MRHLWHRRTKKNNPWATFLSKRDSDSPTGGTIRLAAPRCMMTARSTCARTSGKVDEVAAQLHFAEMRRAAGHGPTALGHLWRALPGQRPAPPGLGRRPGGRAQRQRCQQRRVCARQFIAEGMTVRSHQRRRVLRPRRRALCRPGAGHGRGHPPRLRRPAGRLCLCHRAR